MDWQTCMDWQTFHTHAQGTRPLTTHVPAHALSLPDTNSALARLLGYGEHILEGQTIVALP